MLSIYDTITSIFTDICRPEVSVLGFFWLLHFQKCAAFFCRMAVNKGLNMFISFNYGSIHFQDGIIYAKLQSPCELVLHHQKPFYPTTIRHSRSQKLMADLLHCRSPSFIAINPFLPACQNLFWALLHFYFSIIYSNTKFHHMLVFFDLPCPTQSRLLPKAAVTLQATPNYGWWFCQCGKCANRRQICHTQTLWNTKTFTWRWSAQSPLCRVAKVRSFHLYAEITH